MVDATYWKPAGKAKCAVVGMQLHPLWAGVIYEQHPGSDTHPENMGLTHSMHKVLANRCGREAEGGANMAGSLPQETDPFREDKGDDEIVQKGNDRHHCNPHFDDPDY